jgi:hypothetical protein
MFRLNVYKAKMVEQVSGLDVESILEAELSRI